AGVDGDGGLIRVDARAGVDCAGLDERRAAAGGPVPSIDLVPAGEIARAGAVVGRVGRHGVAVSADGVAGTSGGRVEAAAAEIGGEDGRRAPVRNRHVGRG